MDHFMKHGKSQEEEETELKSKLGNMMSDPNMKPEDVLNALRDKLSSEDQAKIDDLLRSGMTMEEIIKKFVDGGMEGIEQLKNEVHGESEFEKQMKELAGGKNLTPEEMLAQGYSVEEAMKYMMKHGKTEEEEHKILADKLRAEMDKKNMTQEEKLNFLKANLSGDAKKAMDELLAQGYTTDEIIELFKKHGNNLNAIDNELCNPNIEFDDEPPNAHLYAKRN